MATKVDPDSEKIKSLRVRRAWSQEQIADIAGVSHRTIQRIEAGSKASFESLRAIAAAFDLDVNEILEKPQPARKQAQEPPQHFLSRITTGKELFDIVGGAHAGHFDNDELHTQEEVDLVGAFLQDMRDYLDIGATSSHPIESRQHSIITNGFAR